MGFFCGQFNMFCMDGDNIYSVFLDERDRMPKSWSTMGLRVWGQGLTISQQLKQYSTSLKVHKSFA